MPSATTPNYLDPKVLGTISRLDLRARQVVEGFITGSHRSPYNGYSVEFAAHREYVPGDEIKHIDWKVWARNDRLYIKEYEEETNLRCTVLLDCSRSMAYGKDTRDGKPKAKGGKDKDGEGLGKFDYAATIAACLAYFIQQQQDAVGLVTFDREIRQQFPASSHPSQLKMMLHHLQECRTDSATDVSTIFGRLAEQLGRRGLVVLISDLFLPTEDLVKSLRLFRHRRHEVVVMHVMHDHERRFPFDDNTLFRGLEDGSELLTEPRALKKAYLKEVEDFLARSRKACADNGVDYVNVDTAENLDAILAAYLLFRQKRGGGSGRGRPG